MGLAEIIYEKVKLLSLEQQMMVLEFIERITASEETIEKRPKKSSDKISQEEPD